MPTKTFVPRPPSIRARIAHRGARLAIRPLENLIPDSPFGVQIIRKVLATLMAGAGQTARDVKISPVDSDVVGRGRVRGEWVLPADARPDGVILYIHGSGYNLCSTKTHRPLVSRIAAQTGLVVFSTEYRLAPEYPFPAAPDDIERAYDWLIDQGWRPDQVIVAGDSAGGHLALDVTLLQLRAGRPAPAGLVLLSPLADPSCDLIEQREQIIPDAMVSTAAVRRLFAHYLAGTDPRHPRLTHVLTDGEMLPPTLIQAGGAEFLAADAHHLHDMLAATGTDVILEIWPGQMHVFQAAPRAIPEADVALKRATEFMAEVIEARGLRRIDKLDDRRALDDRRSGVIA